jgi:hypothetical protein
MTTATIRASDAERDQVTRMLQQAVAEGRFVAFGLAARAGRRRAAWWHARRWPPEPRWLGPSAHPW